MIMCTSIPIIALFKAHYYNSFSQLNLCQKNIFKDTRTVPLNQLHVIEKQQYTSPFKFVLDDNYEN